jgi:hypothetical protein
VVFLFTAHYLTQYRHSFTIFLRLGFFFCQSLCHSTEYRFAFLQSIREEDRLSFVLLSFVLLSWYFSLFPIFIPFFHKSSVVPFSSLYSHIPNFWNIVMNMIEWCNCEKNNSNKTWELFLIRTVKAWNKEWKKGRKKNTCWNTDSILGTIFWNLRK